MKKLTLVTMILALGLASCSEWVKELPTEPGSFGPISEVGPIITGNPTPGRPGPYEVCTHDYDLFDPRIKGKIYVPVNNRKTCTVLRNFPLVLIAHADGGTYQGFSSANAHLEYEGLAQHLASNAFVVVSINRNGLGADEAFDQLLEDHLDYIYNSSDVKNVVTNQIALIGHSAGGRAVLKHAGVINDYGKQLKSLVVLAPSISDATIDYNLHQVTDAFMGMHVTQETDASAFGANVPGLPMKSTFKAYDNAGVIAGNPNQLTLTKDMIFAVAGNHYFQNNSFTLAYINAFLQVHMNEHTIYNRFLKNQEKPPSLTTIVYQQHADPERLVVADFENGSLKFNALNGIINFSGESITGAQVGWAHQIDGFSPHHTKVLRFEWNETIQVLGMKPSGAISFALPDVDISNYRYVSFRITQVYHTDSNPDGTDRDITILVGSPNLKFGSGINISEFGGPLHFPIKKPAPPGAINQEEQTKNAMRSYIIPLNAFENVDLNSVNHVVLDFSGTGASATTFILDDLEFYK